MRGDRLFRLARNKTPLPKTVGLWAELERLLED